MKKLLLTAAILAMPVVTSLPSDAASVYIYTNGQYRWAPPNWRNPPPNWWRNPNRPPSYGPIIRRCPPGYMCAN